MGFCYTSSGKLCCDICGEAGARKKPCPAGYCQAYACCTGEACKAKLKEHRRTHCAVHCVAASREFKRMLAERAELLAAGRLIRCAAVTEGHGVKVWFESKEHRDHVRYMASATYRAFDILDNVTLEQFEAVGLVTLTLDELPATVAA